MILHAYSIGYAAKYRTQIAPVGSESQVLRWHLRMLRTNHPFQESSMFVAPLFLPSAVDRSAARARATNANVSRPPVRVLAAWFAGGASALALVPALRGGAMLGATLPFWLVAAPAINLAWFARGRIVAAIRLALRRGRRPVAVQARRLQSCSRPERSSRK